MARLNYDDIFSGFLGNITDAKFATLSISDSESLMCEYLHSAMSNPYIVRLFSAFVFDDEIRVVDYQLVNGCGIPFDNNFVLMILSKQMVCEWLRPQVRSTLNTMQFFGGREQKWFSQSQHLNELQNLLENAESEVRNLIRDRGFIWNSYLNNVIATSSDEKENIDEV